MKLIAIPFSHYCEKARWVLDHLDVEYRQVGYLPMMHIPGVMWQTRMRLGKREKTSSPMSTPIVVTDEGDVIHDSAKISRWACERYSDAQTELYPAAHREEIVAIEDDLGETVGPHARRYAYYGVLGGRPEVISTLVRSVPPMQRMAFTVARPVMVAMLRRTLGISEGGAGRSLERIRSAFDRYADRVRDRRFLVGDRFTAADLTMAALSAPMLGISHEDGYGCIMPSAEDMADDAQQVIAELRETPVGRFARRMYAEHRRTSG